MFAGQKFGKLRKNVNYVISIGCLEAANYLTPCKYGNCISYSTASAVNRNYGGLGFPAPKHI